MYGKTFVVLVLVSQNLVYADETTKLPPLVVTGKPLLDEDQEAEKTKSYSTPSSSTATRSKMPNKDIPQSIDVRTKQLLRDLGGQQRSDEIAKSVAGINITWYGNGGTNVPLLNFRGFSNTSGYGRTDFMRDGYRKQSGISTTMDLASIERIEFMKGPSSVVYGKSESLGGAINFISKRPLVNQRQHFDFTLGSFDFYRTTMDVGTALNQKKSVLFRMNAAFEDGNSFRDFANHQSFLFAPSLSFDITDNDRLTVLFDYNQSRLLGEFGIPITPAFAQVPRHTYEQDPNFDHTNVSALNSLVEWQHIFNLDWKLTVGISTSQSDWEQNYTRFTRVTKGQADNFQPIYPFLAVRDPNHETDSRFTQNIEATLVGRLNFLSMDHNLMLGGGYIYSRDKSTDQQATNWGDKNILFDIRNPSQFFKLDPLTFAVQATPTRAAYNFTNPPGLYITNNENFTVFVQDLITVIPQVKVLLGMRYDHVSQETANPTGKGSQSDGRISPRFGIIYQPTDSTSLYGSYTTSFAQRINTNFSANPYNRYKPESGEQFEIGLKQKLTPNLDLTLALYQLTRKNIFLTNPNPNLFRFPLQSGVQRSRGLELSLIGHITDAFRFTGAYTFMKAQVLKDDNGLPVGTERVGVPQHTLNLFGVYSFAGIFKGLEIGTGINYTSSAQVSMPNTFKLPDTFQWDGLVSYQFNPHYKIQVNVKNITDESNYIAAADFGYLSVNPPRSVYATFSADF